MLINLSNIPVAVWSKKQIAAAEREFTEIAEFPFPQIYPEWETSDITKLAIEYSEKIIKLFSKTSNQKNVVHLMGELTFCFALFLVLHEKGIKCVASATEQTEKKDENGNKQIVEEFVKFRDYV